MKISIKQLYVDVYRVDVSYAGQHDARLAKSRPAAWRATKMLMRRFGGA